MSDAPDPPTFRERLDRLNAVVEELEQVDELDLEVALERFEEGRRLHSELLAQLAAFEARLEPLVQDGEGREGVVAMGEDAREEGEDA